MKRALFRHVTIVEAVNISGVSSTAVLVFTALGALCTRRYFRVDEPDSGGPIKMDGGTSTDTEPGFLRDSWYAACHSKKTRSRRLCAMTSKECSSCGESCSAPSGVQTSVH